jgi:hypothetical protein
MEEERFLATGSGGNGFSTLPGQQQQNNFDIGVWTFGQTTGVVGTSITGECIHLFWSYRQLGY